MGREVKDAVGRDERDKSVVGMVLTGAGGGLLRVFCSIRGSDLASGRVEDEPYDVQSGSEETRLVSSSAGSFDQWTSGHA